MGHIAHPRKQFKWMNTFQESYVYIITLIRLIEWIVFYAVSAIFQAYNDSDYKLKVISFVILKFPLAALLSLLFIEIQWNGLKQGGCYP